MTDHKKHYRSSFKAQVAIKALRKDLTDEEVAEEHNVSLENVRKWRETLETGAEHLFHSESSRRHHRHQLRRYWNAGKKARKKILFTSLQLIIAALIVYYAIAEAMKSPSPIVY